MAEQGVRGRLRRPWPEAADVDVPMAVAASVHGPARGSGLRAGAMLLLLVLVSLLSPLGASPLQAAPTAPSEVVLVLSDAMARSNLPVRVECLVLTLSGGRSRGVGGERLSLLVDETEVATAISEPDGRAIFTFEARRLGLHPMRAVHAVGADGPAHAHGPVADGRATLAVWEKRKPLLLVEQAVLPDDAPASASVGAAGESASPAPQVGAVDALSRLGHFFYNLVYLLPQRDDQPRQLDAYRAWLAAHKLPPGIVLSVPAGGEGLTTLMDRLKADGWENLRAGIGRTPAFAQALVTQRIRAVIHGAPVGASERGDYPRKARLAADWTTVRKYLQD